MRRLCSTLCGLAVLAFGAVAPLPAQVCAGFAALDDTRFRVAASAESHI